MKKIIETIKRKWAEYLLEVIVIVGSILGAFALDEWNESRKERKIEITSYNNLLESLMADSIEVLNTIEYIESGIKAQKLFLESTYEELIEKYSTKEISVYLNHAGNISISFFPRYSTYNQLSELGLQRLLQSNSIKSNLADLYDNKYKRYQHIDLSIDKKVELNISRIINGNLKVFEDKLEIHPANAFDYKKLGMFYDELNIEFGSTLTTANYALISLETCQESIQNLLNQIRKELKRLEKM